LPKLTFSNKLHWGFSLVFTSPKNHFLHITYITLLFRVKLFQSFEKTGQDKGRWDSTQSI